MPGAKIGEGEAEERGGVSDSIEGARRASRCAEKRKTCRQSAGGLFLKTGSRGRAMKRKNHHHGSLLPDISLSLFIESGEGGEGGPQTFKKSTILYFRNAKKYFHSLIRSHPIHTPSERSKSCEQKNYQEKNYMLNFLFYERADYFMHPVNSVCNP